MLLRAAAATAINGYQRYISPYKGYRCAHGALHGGDTCSAWGRRIVLRFGLLAFLPLMLRRFRACAQAQRILLLTSTANADASPTKPEDKNANAEPANSVLGYVAAQAGVECCLGCAFIPF